MQKDKWARKKGHAQLVDICAIIADKNGRLLAANRDNHAVELYDQMGDFLGNILGSAEGLRYPQRLCLDKSNERLFIHHHPHWPEGDSQILVLDYKPLSVTTMQRTVNTMVLKATWMPSLTTHASNNQQ